MRLYARLAAAPIHPVNHSSRRVPLIPNRLGDFARTIGLPAAKRAAGLVTRVLPIPQPTLLVGPGASARLGQAIAGFGHRRIMIVTDPIVAKLGLAQPLTAALRAGRPDAADSFVVFDEIAADAPIPVVEKGIEVFRYAKCDALVAIGGGSVIDAAKAIGLAAANGKHPRELVGYFRGLHAPPPIYAVPTTAGTGSEVTVAAVISDPQRAAKLVIADTRIVPKMAALDPELMTGLPREVTAASGMDALTHAIEAFIGYWGTRFTDRMALSAVGMIYGNLPRVCAHGKDLAAREQMALASTYAGLAFTRANVGNVHAIAHQLGGKYHTPHGLANAILLPHVLRFSSAAITGKLAVLARHAKLGSADEPDAELAQKFLDSIDALSRRIGIPRCLDALREEDIPQLARAACREADFNYPVPRVMSQQDCEALLRAVLPERRAKKPRPPRRTRRSK
ncbi:iron-containing alcohol dehydrogenase [Betaproteobacteria bacterium PRO7]|nr:iron-containing alcohol dehydrogenase [Betaproteobacteria bacterium PRO7]